MRIIKALLITLVCILGSLVALIVWADRRRAVEADGLERDWANSNVSSIGEFGATRTLEITPLVNWHASSSEFKTEPGVSYLIRTDDYRILFDVGFNQDEGDPSPLQHNMEKLGISISEIDAVFLSHMHRDHVGGRKWERAKSLSVGSMQDDLLGKRLIAPVALTYPGAKVEVVSSPQALMTGIASTGPIPRRLFLGRVDEQVSSSTWRTKA